jgi:calcineurin-like phosphoesterase family protein
MLWFTADTHFNHKSIIDYCGRPFSSVEEMNETIISNWNNVVSTKDHVYHLGDFAFGSNDSVRKIRYRLKGKIHLILGNHDYKNKVNRLSSCFTEVKDLLTLKHNKQKIILCHYCMNVWDSSHYNSWHLFGHSHNTWHTEAKSFDVGVDSWEFKPISFDDVTRIMQGKPNNPNWVERLKGYSKEEYEKYRNEE